jgi:hypothetical protein
MTHLYDIWKSIHARCKSLPLYVEQGIKVCPEWSDYTEFYSWAVSNGYYLDLMIDRKDGSKGYEPSNCRWVTREQQNQNTRKLQAGSSKYKGVSWHKQRQCWRAYVCVGARDVAKQISLGLFTDEIEAARAYDAWIRENRPNFGVLNFP